MRYVKFGSSDMVVSEACLGTMMWGSFNTDEETVFSQLDTAILDKGVNFIDTAEMYPVPCHPKYVNRTEVLIGKWLAKRTLENGGTVDRKKLYIATKAAGDMRIFGEGAWPNMRACKAGREDPCGERPQKNVTKEELDSPDTPGPEHTSEQLLKACQASIERMGCDYIDLYQLHWPNRYVPGFGKVEYRPEKEYKDDIGNIGSKQNVSPEAFDAIVLGVKNLLDQGLIKHWGLSNEMSFGIMSFCASCDRLGVPRPVSVQNDVSLLNRGFECELAEVCRHCNIAGMPYGALAGGTLSGKYDGRSSEKDADGKYKYYDVEEQKDGVITEIAPPKGRHHDRPAFQPRYHGELSLIASRKYSSLAKKHGLKPVTLAVAWMNSRWWNTSVITGSTSSEQLVEYLDAFDVELAEEILKEVDAIHRECRNPNISD